MKAIVALVLLAGACSLLSEGPPENVCNVDADCFRAQGEICDLESHRCIPGDGGVAVDAAIDAGTDAQ